ncbi:hypothetical protein D3C73_1603880 [compost metagenome]
MHAHLRMPLHRQGEAAGASDRERLDQPVRCGGLDSQAGPKLRDALMVQGVDLRIIRAMQPGQ